MRSAGQVLGALFIIVGVVFLVGTVQGGLGLGEMLPWLWPLLLVALGLWFVLAAAERRHPAPPGWGAGTASGTGEWPASGTGEWPAAGTGAPNPPRDAAAGAGTTPVADTTQGPGAGAGWPGAGTGPGGDAGRAPGTDRDPGAWTGAADPGGWAGAGDPGGWAGAGAGRTGSAWAYSGGWPRDALRQQRFIGEVEVAGVFEAGPMRIETFIGEIRVDLTRATFPEGETAIRVNTGIGEVRVLLPADIPAAVRASTLLGEAEAIGHAAGPVLGEAYGETEGFANAPRRIRLEAQALIGEVAVRRARPDPTAPDAPGSGFAPMSRAAAPPAAGTQDRTEPPG